MTVGELHKRLYDPDSAARIVLLDVREPWELEIASLPGTLDIPMGEVAQRLDDLKARCEGKDLVVMCRSGARSASVANFLQQNGLSPVINLDGGILAWSEHIDASVHPY